MPLFEYRCPLCGAECNQIRCVADRSLGEQCYRCGKANMEQIISKPPIGIVKNPAVPKRSK